MRGKTKSGAGFTIVEVLIVLAVSGLMFALAINAENGQQGKTEFKTGLDTFKSQLNQVLSNVNDGNYTYLNGASCSAGAIGQPSFSPPPSNGTCTVIGEVLSFDLHDYKIFPVIGRNYIAGSTDNQVVTMLSDAKPYVSTSEVQTIPMPFGLTIIDAASSTDIHPSGSGALALFNFNNFEGTSLAAGQGLPSGSQHVEVVVIAGSSFDNSGANASLVNNGLSECAPNVVCTTAGSMPINPSSGVAFCVLSGTTNAQSALITIGGPNNPSTASDKIYSSKDCS